MMRLCNAVSAAVITLFAAAAVSGPASAASAEGASPLRCNGSVSLCDVPLGEVAFATTHNSMSSPADHFIGPNQGRTIAQQLRSGIRGFQIDAYPGVARTGRIYTDLAGPFGSQATDLSPALVATATRIHRSLGAPPAGTPNEVYLCHTFCELGGVKMIDEARAMRWFLDAHPDEVLALVIEDYVAPQRIRQVLDAAGLGSSLQAYDTGTPLPTLGEMIRSGKHLLVSLENGDGGPTLPNAFAALVDETPFTFLTASALRDAASCAPNRGPDDAPIFQLNHWVTPPSPRRARAANALLRSRVERCAAARGRVPTLVAVDFAESSNVISVVRTLNRGR